MHSTLVVGTLLTPWEEKEEREREESFSSYSKMRRKEEEGRERERKQNFFFFFFFFLSFFPELSLTLFYFCEPQHQKELSFFFLKDPLTPTYLYAFWQLKARLRYCTVCTTIKTRDISTTWQRSRNELI